MSSTHLVIDGVVCGVQSYVFNIIDMDWGELITTMIKFLATLQFI